MIQMSTTTDNKSAWLSYVSRFTSLSTLLCCALPSLLVLVGPGATVASMLSALPWLVTLSHHRIGRSVSQAYSLA
jgi:mercuric ion transport protein